MNSVDFASETLGLSVSAVVTLLSSDELRCNNEEQVLDFVISYLSENAASVD